MAVLPTVIDCIDHNHQLSISNSETQISRDHPLRLLDPLWVLKIFSLKIFLCVSFEKNQWFTPTTQGLIRSIGNFKRICLISIFLHVFGVNKSKGQNGICLKPCASWNSLYLLLFLMGKFVFSFCCFIGGCIKTCWTWSKGFLANRYECLRHLALLGWLAVLEASHASGETTGKWHHVFWLTFCPGVQNSFENLLLIKQFTCWVFARILNTIN